MYELHRLYFAQANVEVNQNGGYYQRGTSYPIHTKLKVAATYLEHKERLLGSRPNISLVARECNVGWHFVEKIENELFIEGHVLAPKDIYRRRSENAPHGPGSLTLSDTDVFVLYRLYRKNPQRSLRSYVNWLFYHTGTIVSESTVSRFFNHGFLIAGRFCKPNMVPYDKFRPKNIAKAKEFIRMMAKIDPRRLKYCDEKSLKGKSICCKKARRDVRTGIVPATMTEPDLRNTYSIIGICGIDKKVTPVRFRITEATVDAELFAIEIEDAIRVGYLRPGNVLVLDNATNHTGKENTVLEDWLWEDHKIFVLFLPARTPEWNPIELLWNCLEERLKHGDWRHIEGPGKVVKCAAEVF